MVLFWNSIFSNFYHCSFEFKGLSFKSSEQAFMFCKARHFGDTSSITKILEATTPKEAKKLGREVNGFDNTEWEKVRYQYMVEVLVAKFEQNDRLKKQLLSTGEKELVEASPYDKQWGIGIHWEDEAAFDKTNWKGLNLLGKALMEVRTTLKD